MSMLQKDLSEWKMMPFTKQVLEDVQNELDVCVADIASGSLLGDTIDKTAMNVSWKVGYIAGLTYLLELEGEADE